MSHLFWASLMLFFIIWNAKEAADSLETKKYWWFGFNVAMILGCFLMFAVHLFLLTVLL